ncbi:hypothetical protein EGY25_00865 [Brevundimonas intermedia]|uniref:Uncharacterized protein n=1 Tax=Brevundimonas intermedia TaxID=74315 RepID=A0A4Y9S566_9CAUL|nr:hypothetical protein [Brevundimonas intermedia]TFW15176.1 hypothetical protein EGY25_00865 [Brevundimonas intermedia]
MDGHRVLRLGETLRATVHALPRLWRGAWGAILAASVVWSIQPLAAGAASLIWAPFGLVVTLVLAGALGRIAITEDLLQARRLGLGPAGLQFGRPELRLLGAGLLCAVFLAMILSVVALALLALFGMAELNAQAIELRQWSAVGPVWKLALLALVTVFALFAIVAFTVRLSLFAPATVGRGHMVSLQSMSIARGAFWPLLVGLVVTAAPKIALVLLWGVGLLSGQAGWVVFAVVLAGVQFPLTMALVGRAYRQLESWTALEGKA